MHGESKTQKPRKGPTFWEHVPPFLPWLGGPPSDPRDWYEPFLTHLAVTGQVMLASHHARVHRSFAYAQRDVDPGFRQAWADAIDYHAERVPAELLQMGREHANPLPYFGYARAHWPEKWSEKAQLQTLSVSLTLNQVNLGATDQDEAQAALSLARGLFSMAADAMTAPPTDDADAAQHAKPVTGQIVSQTSGGHGSQMGGSQTGSRIPALPDPAQDDTP